jgi:hypothetical protein
VLIATALQLLRRRMRKVTEEKPDLQRAVPILDLPVSMAFVLSLLIVAPIYPQAPRFIQAIMGTAALIPTVLILRKLLQPNSYPILTALVVMYFVGQLRLLAASLPHSGRLLFLGQISFLSGCFGVGIYRRQLLKPMVASGEESERLR